MRIEKYATDKQAHVDEPHKGDKRYVRRKQKGQFKAEVSVGRSLAIDRPHKAKNEAPKGHRDRGD